MAVQLRCVGDYRAIVVNIVAAVVRGRQAHQTVTPKAFSHTPYEIIGLTNLWEWSSMVGRLRCVGDHRAIVVDSIACSHTPYGS